MGKIGGAGECFPCFSDIHFLSYQLLLSEPIAYDRSDTRSGLDTKSLVDIFEWMTFLKVLSDCLFGLQFFWL